MDKTVPVFEDTLKKLVEGIRSKPPEVLDGKLVSCQFCTLTHGVDGSPGPYHDEDCPYLVATGLAGAIDYAKQRDAATRFKGGELRIGDVLKVWWTPKTGKPQTDTIVDIRPYTKIYDVFPEGASTVKFLSGSKMTIDHAQTYEKVPVG